MGVVSGLRNGKAEPLEPESPPPERTLSSMTSQAHEPNVRAGQGLALICLCLLGGMPILSNGRPPGTDALAFAFFLSVWQWLFATPLFAREIRERGFAPGVGHRERRRVLLVLLVTGLIFAASTYLYVLGVERAGAVSAAIAIQAYPLFAILWESLFLKRGKTPLELVLTLGLLAALYFLGTGGTWRIDGLSFWFLAALSVPFLWSVAHVILKEELARAPVTPAQITFIRVAVSSVMLGTTLAVIAPHTLIPLVLDTTFQAFALAMGLVYYLELVVWFHALRHISVSMASSINTPWPALTMALSVVILGETVAPYQIIALVAVVGLLYALMAAGARAARPRQAS
jgi:drug/metabolite transporter (DMT)-like permease